MNEETYPSAQVMIKIDGTRIKAIREAKGLTQLYIATVVDVTTDTVSRWENKRYPTIKKENGLKLAEALEVELEEILDAGEPEEEQADAAAATETAQPGPHSPGAEPQPGQSLSNPDPAAKHWYNNLGHLGIIAVTFIIICVGVYLYSYLNRGASITEINATRIVAPHFIAGQPLPIFLSIEKESDKPVSIILKENLPPGCRLEAASPPLSGSSTSEIKWLTKISQSAFFFYTVVTDESFSGDLSFSGLVKNGVDGEAVEIAGGGKTVSGLHHWADTNGDNRISDEEILLVYDLLSGDTDTIVDLDQLEEMWLGEGYIWNFKQQAFSIME